MSIAPHDFVSVDMRGMKAALVAHARARRVGVSTIVRAAVARELGLERPFGSPEATSPAEAQTVKVLLRLSSAEALQLAAGAREAQLSRGAYVGALIGGVAVLSRRTDHLAALTATCGELAILSRNIHHLTTLLRQGAEEAARSYREMLDSLVAEVRRHLHVCADALADQRPKRAGSNVPRPIHRGDKQHG